MRGRNNDRARGNCRGCLWVACVRCGVADPRCRRLRRAWAAGPGAARITGDRGYRSRRVGPSAVSTRLWRTNPSAAGGRGAVDAATQHVEAANAARDIAQLQRQKSGTRGHVRGLPRCPLLFSPVSAHLGTIGERTYQLQAAWRSRVGAVVPHSYKTFYVAYYSLPNSRPGGPIRVCGADMGTIVGRGTPTGIA
jgi:hypothetical protein